MKTIKILFAAFCAVTLTLSLAACSPDSLNRYRYPCQDPVNWKNAECNPPVCEASGLCTKDMFKPTINTGSGTP